MPLAGPLRCDARHELKRKQSVYGLIWFGYQALIRPSATFSHARAREKALNSYCLLPSEGWEKVPDRADEGLLAGMSWAKIQLEFQPTNTNIPSRIAPARLTRIR
jgi:hypothetical protein